MRTVLLVLVALLGACTASPVAEPCPDGALQACRADGQCRCGARCDPGSDCPDTAEGPAGCAIRDDGAGVCVDIAWLTGLPRGRVPCGATTCDGASARCVQWAEGDVACAPRCTANDACPSGCCTPLADRSGRDLGSVCAPSRAYRCLPPGEAPGCTTLNACVTVTFAALGTRCAVGDSAEVHVRNDCDRPADVVICYERREGACACSVHRAVQPGAETDPPSWACSATGRYLVSARAAGDPDACHEGC